MPDSVVDPAARDKYLLQVTAGPSYDVSTHKEVAVNSSEAHIIENDLMTCWLNVRIKDYHGLPHNSPPTSTYFTHPLHKSDRYSIGFSFIPKRDINGADLVTGFDFDHPIRDRLPPGFKYAMKIATTILDPGLFSEPYSDKPYLYGPALSSFFTFRIGDDVADVGTEKQLKTFAEDAKSVIEEGADGSGQRIRADQHIPAKTSKRRKNFLDSAKRENFTFEKGRLYQADFFNPYLDFANFALRIPGFSISVVKYIDNKTHQLRYVLRDQKTDEVLFVVIFNLLFGQGLEDTLREKDAEVEAHATEVRNNDTTATTSEEPRPYTPTHRPQTSRSSFETAPASGSSSAPDSDVDEDPVKREEKKTAATSLANSIYSGFAALGFGRTASSSSEDSNLSLAKLRKTEEKNALEQTKTLEKKVDGMKDSTVEQYLQSRHTST
jgi:hypothetical protein